MPTLENDRLVFRFPATELDAAFSINFQRTLRIPDSDKTYPLPPGLGRFPLRHAEDYPALPASTRDRGGVVLPIWQAEALWLDFSTASVAGPEFPVAIKVAAGKINAVSGEPWRPGLRTQPQDYMVAPDQPWLDGYAVERGVIRQFVAMPLGEGYSAEEQLTGQAEWGGLQIAVMPLKAEIWAEKKARWESRGMNPRASLASYSMAPGASYSCAPAPMSLAPGGRMRQEIHDDPYGPDCWDVAAAQRVFVTLLHGRDWKHVTGEPAPDAPPSARDYSKAGLPWFEHYGVDQSALPGGRTLGRLTSLAQQFKQTTGAALPESQDVETAPPTPLGPGAANRPVSHGKGWE